MRSYENRRTNDKMCILQPASRAIPRSAADPRAGDGVDPTLRDGLRKEADKERPEGMKRNSTAIEGQSSRLTRPLSRSMRYAFNTVLSHAENAHYHDLHHGIKHRHEAGEICPAEYHVARQAYLIREFLETNAQAMASPPLTPNDHE